MTEQQPAPRHQPGKRSIQAGVRADLITREQLGIQRYGTPLQPDNGRDALRDAYEEALDLACYLKQALVERDGEPITAVLLAEAWQDLQHKDDLIAELRRQVEALYRTVDCQSRQLGELRAKPASEPVEP